MHVLKHRSACANDGNQIVTDNFDELNVLPPFIRRQDLGNGLTRVCVALSLYCGMRIQGDHVYHAVAPAQVSLEMRKKLMPLLDWD